MLKKLCAIRLWLFLDALMGSGKRRGGMRVLYGFLLLYCVVVFGTLFGLLFWVYLIIPGLGRRDTYLFNMLPYLVTIAVLIFVSLRNKKENQPPASLGLAYFREER